VCKGGARTYKVQTRTFFHFEKVPNWTSKVRAKANPTLSNASFPSLSSLFLSISLLSSLFHFPPLQKNVENNKEIKDICFYKLPLLSSLFPSHSKG
jgi:hypothetical protein